MVAHERPGHRLGARLHHRLGDRDIGRFSGLKNLVGYTGLCLRVHQSGSSDYRGPLVKNGPKYLRWALIEAAVHAGPNSACRDHYERTVKRLGRQRGNKVARVEVARKLTGAIWHMLTKSQPFAPARSQASGRLTTRYRDGYRRGAGWDTVPDLVLRRSIILAWERCWLTSRETATPPGWGLQVEGAVTITGRYGLG